MKAASLLRLHHLAVVLGLFLLTACNNDNPAQETAVRGFSDYFVIGLGDKSPRLQMALHPLEQQQGLMHRKDLGINDGMIFVYNRPQAMSYWMRNTPSPLDIGYFDAKGVLLEIYPMLPFDETPVRSRSDQIQFAVEMNQGWYKANNIRPGARLNLKQVAEALKQRGINPAEMHVQP